MKSFRRDHVKQKRFEAATQCLVPNLYRYAYWCSCDPVLAQIVVRAALMQARRTFASINEGRAVKLWLLNIVRCENARMLEFKRLQIVDISARNQSTDTHRLIIVNTEVFDLHSALAELDIKYREPLVLQVLLGSTTKEIAELMGLKRREVLTRLSHARNKLRAVEQTQLSENGEISAPIARGQNDPIATTQRG